MAKPIDFSTNVFVNCPFDEDYRPLLRAMVFSVIICGFTPCLALQQRDAGAIRIEKIKKLIRGCRLGIHDISRTETDADSCLPRFNMPFELGLDLGAREYGGGYLKEKQILILDKERYRFQRFLSDIAGQDIAAHNQSPAILVEKVRSWLNTMRASGPPLLGATRITSLYDNFLVELPKMCAAAKLDHANLDFNDFLHFCSEWIALYA
jgi:hypothetical protein